MEEAREFAVIDMSSRPAIPAAMKRAVKEEAGYRCAVPTCRDKGPFDFEHIDDWAKVREHEFHNIILLCVGCHARVTRKEISKEAIRTYKRNLAVISGRYSLYEIRLMEKYWEANLRVESKTHLIHDGTIPQIFSESEMIHLAGLRQDKLISVREWELDFSTDPFLRQLDETIGTENTKKIMRSNNMTKYLVMPTFQGYEFIKKYFSGEDIDD